MTSVDSTAYFTLVATLLLGILVLTVVQLRAISKSIRASPAGKIVRTSFFAVTLVAAVSVMALAQTLPAARNAPTWLSYRVAEDVVSVLLGVSLLASIVSSGSAFFRRHPPSRALPPVEDKLRAKFEGSTSATPRWVVVVVVALAIIMGRR